MTVTELHQRVRRSRLEPAEPVPSPEHELREVLAIPLSAAIRIATRVALVSYAMWLAALGLFAVTCALLGLVGEFEHMVRSVGFRGFHLVSVPVVVMLIALGAIWTIVFVVIAMLTVAAFNLASARSHRLQVVLGPPLRVPRA